jgi:hypothetical protein
MQHYRRARHFGSLVLAAVVAIATLSVVVHATQVITTPNAAFISYSLATIGANSAPITPVAGQAVLIMGTETGASDCSSPGVGQVSMLRSAGTPSPFITPPMLVWTGLESNNFSPNSSTITSGGSATPGTHILFVDHGHRVDLQVNSASTFVVHNGSCGPVKGNVTMIW